MIRARCAWALWTAAFALSALAFSASTPHVAHAQAEAGRVVDDSTSAVLDRVLVSLERSGAHGWTSTDTTRTDAEGLFQFGALDPGVYRVVFLFGGKQFPGPVDTLAPGEFAQRQYSLPLTRTLRAIVRAFQDSLRVHRVEPMGGTRSLPYPPELLNADIKASVTAQYVVTPDGRADLGTLRILTELPHRAFGDAIYTYLQTARFKPAMIAGRAVRQLVQQEFVFTP